MVFCFAKRDRKKGGFAALLGCLGSVLGDRLIF